MTLLDPPRGYDDVPGYYAVFLPDPDGLELEVVHLPGCSPSSPGTFRPILQTCTSASG